MELGKMLARLCEKKRWSLSRLSRESGVPKPTIHGWTTGRTGLKLDQLKKVASALEVTIHELAFGTPDPYESSGEEILRELFTGDVRVSIHKIERRTKQKK